MLYFYFRPQREPLHMIEVQLSVITYFVIEHVNECYGCYYQSHPLLWLNSIGFSLLTQLNKVEFYLFILNPTLLTSPFACYMAKDSTKHIPENIIG